LTVKICRDHHDAHPDLDRREHLDARKPRRPSKCACGGRTARTVVLGERPVTSRRQRGSHHGGLDRSRGSVAVSAIDIAGQRRKKMMKSLYGDDADSPVEITLPNSIATAE